MQVVLDHLNNIFMFFIHNWIAGVVLVVVAVILAYKKTDVLIKIVVGIIAVYAVVYILVFLENSTLSGMSSKERMIEVEKTLE